MSCTFWDTGNHIESCDFPVTVRGPETQTANLITLVNSFNLPAWISNSLDSKLSNAMALLTARDKRTACDVLNAFVNETSAQIGKKITRAQADQMITDAQRIKAAAGCP